jgi:Skp family chaperone for outer membrane proteins
MIRSILLASATLMAATSAFAQTTPAPAAAPPAAAPAAAAPVASPVVVYDLGRLIETSDAGKDMRTKLNAIADQINRELEPDQRQLQTELAAIRGTPVGEAQTPAAQQRQENFQRLYAQFEQKQQRLSAVMQLTERNALGAFSQALAPALRQTMTARSGLVALQANAVEAFVPGVDITGDLVARINASTRTINVTRATLPTQGAAPAAAPGGTTPARPPGAAPARPATPAPVAPRQPSTPAPR